MTQAIWQEKIVAVNDWPKDGVKFLDITPLIGNQELFRGLIDGLAKRIDATEIDKIVGVEARGFIMASALAYKLNKGLVLARKKGKLPGKTVSESYGLEYGQDTLEIGAGAIRVDEKVLIVDDVLATGGTIKATAKIVEKLGGKIKNVLVFIELEKLPGRKTLSNYDVKSLLKL